MSRYRVKWEIDIYAESAHDAAVKAREVQLNPESQATVFHVDHWMDSKGLIVKPYIVDLQEE